MARMVACDGLNPGFGTSQRGKGRLTTAAYDDNSRCHGEGCSQFAKSLGNSVIWRRDANVKKGGSWEDVIRCKKRSRGDVLKNR